MENKKQKKKSSIGKYVALLFGVVIGFVCGILIAEFSEPYSNSSGSLSEDLLTFVLWILGFYLAFLLQTIIHEAGHLVFGLMSGYKFSSFRIQSFMWVKDNDKVVFRRLKIAGTGGQCLMSPPELVDGKLPVFLFNMGGVLMNLFASAIAVLLFLLLRDIAFISDFLLVFAVVGVATALLNGIPMRTDAINNDGYNAFALRRDKDAVRAFWIQLTVNAEGAKGTRLKDMPEEWFAVPSDDLMKNSMIATVGVFACNRTMDMHKFEEARTQIEHLLEIESGIVGLHRNLLLCDLIYIELITENRKEVIDSLMTKELKQFMASMKKFPSVIRTE
ncbi:MAG: hypothetical protein IKC39_00700, partial [Clostridia bacterium]|nr:hypothetical protein [Clostridia bacterium]